MRSRPFAHPGACAVHQTPSPFAQGLRVAGAMLPATPPSRNYAQGLRAAGALHPVTPPRLLLEDHALKCFHQIAATRAVHRAAGPCLAQGLRAAGAVHPTTPPSRNTLRFYEPQVPCIL